MRQATLRGQCAAEFIGTFILVFFGVGSVNAAVLAGVTQGLWQVAAIWGVGVALAIYATGAISGAHLNPAITVAMAVWRGFPLRKIGPYILAQLAGAFCCSLLLFGLFHGLVVHYEAVHHLVRGAPGSELAAMVFGEYFPNPAMFGTGPEAYQQVALITAFLAEAIGTAFLACFVFTLSAPRGPVASRAVPLFIGLALAVIIMIIAPLTQAGLNPARDLGPRLVAYLCGWGKIAIPGPRGGFFVVYILAPIVGAVLGSGVYQWLSRGLRARAAAEEAQEAASPRRSPAPAVERSEVMPEYAAPTPEEPAVILVPCAHTGRAGCRIVRRAVELVSGENPEIAVAAPEECRQSAKSFIVAVDGSSACEAIGELRQLGVKPAQVVSAPAVLAAKGLLRAGVKPQNRIEALAQALAESLRESLSAVLEEARVRREYRAQMAPIVERFQAIWGRLEGLPEPNGTVEHAEAQKVELLGRRARNLFVKFDEFLPPAEWSQPHDLFQDALLCIAYATEGWAAGDRERWAVHMEKARAQIRPLLRRLDG